MTNDVEIGALSNVEGERERDRERGCVSSNFFTQKHAANAESFGRFAERKQRDETRPRFDSLRLRARITGDFTVEFNIDTPLVLVGLVCVCFFRYLENSRLIF